MDGQPDFWKALQLKYEEQNKILQKRELELQNRLDAMNSLMVGGDSCQKGGETRRFSQSFLENQTCVCPEPTEKPGFFKCIFSMLPYSKPKNPPPDPPLIPQTPPPPSKQEHRSKRESYSRKPEPPVNIIRNENCMCNPCLGGDESVPQKESNESSCICSFCSKGSAGSTGSGISQEKPKPLPSQPIETIMEHISSFHSNHNNGFASASKVSLKSEDLYFMKNIHELVTQQKAMLNNINELEEKAIVYEKVFNEYRNINFADNDCRCNQTRPVTTTTTDPEQKTTAELKLENFLLKNELKDMRLEVRQYLERMEGPMQYKIESEKYKSFQLQEKLDQLTRDMEANQETYEREMNCVKMKLCTAQTQNYELTNLNESLRQEIEALNARCIQLEEDLIRQKISEAESLKRMKAALEAQTNAAVVKDECNLHQIAREISKVLKECEPCGDCMNLPEDLTTAAKLLKSLTDMLESKIPKSQPELRPEVPELKPEEPELREIITVCQDREDADVVVTDFESEEQQQQEARGSITKPSQEGRGSVSKPSQEGRGSVSKPSQEGRGSVSKSAQEGRGSIAKSLQEGRGSIAKSLQEGRGSVSKSPQEGRGSIAKSLQEGRGSISKSAQEGRGSIARSLQEGRGSISKSPEERRSSVSRSQQGDRTSISKAAPEPLAELVYAATPEPDMTVSQTSQGEVGPLNIEITQEATDTTDDEYTEINTTTRIEEITVPGKPESIKGRIEEKEPSIHSKGDRRSERSSHSVDKKPTTCKCAERRRPSFVEDQEVVKPEPKTPEADYKPGCKCSKKTEELKKRCKKCNKHAGGETFQPKPVELTQPPSKKICRCAERKKEVVEPPPPPPPPVEELAIVPGGGSVDQIWPKGSQKFMLCHQVTASKSKDLLKSETSVKCLKVKENFPFDVDTHVDVLNKPPDGVHVTTTITNSGMLEVITEGPEGVIETTLVYTNSGNVEVVTEILEYNSPKKICNRGKIKAGPGLKGAVKDKEPLAIEAPSGGTPLPSELPPTTESPESPEPELQEEVPPSEPTPDEGLAPPTTPGVNPNCKCESTCPGSGGPESSTEKRSSLMEPPGTIEEEIQQNVEESVAQPETQVQEIAQPTGEDVAITQNVTNQSLSLNIHAEEQKRSVTEEAPAVAESPAIEDSPPVVEIPDTPPETPESPSDSPDSPEA